MNMNKRFCKSQAGFSADFGGHPAGAKLRLPRHIGLLLVSKIVSKSYATVRNNSLKLVLGVLLGCLAATLLPLSAPGTSAALSGSPAPEPGKVIRTLTPIAPGAAEQVRADIGFSPFRLGASTTVVFSFRITSPPHTVPQPLIGIDLALPQDLGAGTSNLGLVDCNARTIVDVGISGCPPNSFVGRGSATAVVPIGPALIHEHVQVGLFAAASKGEHLEVLYGAEGVTPVFDVLTFRGEILEGTPPYGEEIATFIPPIETLPEAPYASVVSMSSTIGPKHLTYYRNVHGRRTAFHPEGLQLPSTCPRHGFKFAAVFTFLDQATKTVHTTIRCSTAQRGRAGLGAG